jgi:hypothetical protein
VARTYVVNPFSQSELLNTYSKFVEMEKAGGGAGQRDVILQNVKVMMSSLPFGMANQVQEKSELINKYDNSPIELNT